VLGDRLGVRPGSPSSVGNGGLSPTLRSLKTSAVNFREQSVHKNQFSSQKALLLACLGTVGLSFVELPNALYAQTCMPHLDLVNSSDDELQNAVPCDFIGAAYLIGLGFGLNGYKGSADAGNYSYYPLFRYYLELTHQ
jgi:hypothetical protein